LGIRHKLGDFLYPSQLKYVKTEIAANSNSTVDQDKVKAINDAVIDCIIADSRPFGDFRKRGMKKFLSIVVPGYVPQHRKTVARQIVKRFNTHFNKLKDKLKKANHISLTTDVWKSKHLTYFIVLTAHFFDDNFKYHSLKIAFKKMNGRHLSSHLASVIQQELKALEINNVISITTDNASDIVKATSNGFGNRISCLCHNLNLIVKSLINFSTKESKKCIKHF
jgi:hypothetical protein